MIKKITPVILIFFSCCILVLWSGWHNNIFGLTVVKSQSADSVSVGCAIFPPAVNQVFSPAVHLAVDTTVVSYTSSDIAYSHFTAPFVHRSNDTWEYCIIISKDSFSYSHIFISESIGIIETLIENSVFKIQDNVIYVQDYLIQILDDEKLKVLNLPEIPSGTILYCTTRYYDNERRMKYRGSWENGKKHGEWTYIDEEGKIFREVYECGNLLKREEKIEEYRFDERRRH